RGVADTSMRVQSAPLREGCLASCGAGGRREPTHGAAVRACLSSSAKGWVMKALDPNDQLFLFIERRQQPMHVAALQLFSVPESADDDYVLTLVEQLRSFRRPTSPFNKRLVTRFGWQFWEEDTDLDLDLHLRHEALPRPGRIRELLSLVS